MPTEMQVMERLRNLRDPEIGRSLGEMGMLSSAAIGASNSISVTIDLPTPAYPRRERITEAVKSAIRESIPDAGPVEVAFISNVRGQMSGGSIGLRAKSPFPICRTVDSCTMSFFLRFSMYFLIVSFLVRAVFVLAIYHQLNLLQRQTTLKPSTFSLRVSQLWTFSTSMAFCSCLVPFSFVVWFSHPKPLSLFGASP